MNILLFGGFLGSGKTSVILQTARYIVENKNETVAIIENEIGETGIDDKVMAVEGLVVKGIFAGCVCCQIIGDLLRAINEIHASVRPGWLIIEATGLAVPGRIMELIQKYCRYYEFLKTIVVADAGRWEELYEVTGSFVVSQVESGDVVLINKVYLIDDSRCKSLAEEMKRFNGRAEIILTKASGDIPVTTLQEMLQL